MYIAINLPPLSGFQYHNLWVEVVAIWVNSVWWAQVWPLIWILLTAVLAHSGPWAIWTVMLLSHSRTCATGRCNCSDIHWGPLLNLLGVNRCFCKALWDRRLRGWNKIVTRRTAEVLDLGRSLLGNYLWLHDCCQLVLRLDVCETEVWVYLYFVVNSRMGVEELIGFVSSEDKDTALQVLLLNIFNLLIHHDGLSKVF